MMLPGLRLETVLRGFLLGPALLLLLRGVSYSDAAPHAKPVHVYEGYSSISKSVTVTKRLVFHMNNEHQADQQKQSETRSTDNSSSNSQNTTSNKFPFVNHSIQYSIETNIENLDGDKLPSIPMETITNDLNEMVNGGFKLTSDSKSVTTDTRNPSITTKLITTTVTSDLPTKTSNSFQSTIASSFDKLKGELHFDDIIQKSDAEFSLADKSNFSDQHSLKTLKLNITEDENDHMFKLKNEQKKASTESYNRIATHEKQSSYNTTTTNIPIIMISREEEIVSNIPTETITYKTTELEIALDDGSFNSQPTIPIETTIIPSVTNKQQTTIIPSVTNKQETTMIPSVTNKQQTTIIPSVTNIQETTMIPSVTNKQETTIIPSVTNKQETTMIPSVANKQETTIIPSVTNIQETTMIPSVTNIQETTMIPSVTTMIPSVTTMIPSVTTMIPSVTNKEEPTDESNFYIDETTDEYISPTTIVPIVEDNIMEIKLENVFKFTINTNTSDMDSNINSTRFNELGISTYPDLINVTPSEFLQDETPADQFTTDSSIANTEIFIIETLSPETVMQTTPLTVDITESIMENEPTISSINSFSEFNASEQNFNLTMENFDFLRMEEIFNENGNRLKEKNDSLVNIEPDSVSGKDGDYISLAMGESIEIGGSFPSYIDETPIESSVTPGSNSHFDYESYFDYPVSDSSVDTTPTLDISSILSEIDFSKIDFEKLDLSSIDLTGVDLGGLDFSKIPSNLSLDEFDLSKLPSNINFDSLDLSTLPKNLSFGGINISQISPSDIANFDLSSILPKSSNGPTGSNNLHVSNYPSHFDLSPLNPSERPFSRARLPNFESSRFHSTINPNRVPPFLTHNFPFSGNENSPMPMRNRPPRFPMNVNFRPSFPTNFGHPRHQQFIVVDNFGNREVVDPNSMNIQKARLIDPNMVRMREQSRIPENSFIRDPTQNREKTKLSESKSSNPHFFNIGERNPVQFVPDTQFRGKRPTLPFNHRLLPNFRQNNFEVRQHLPPHLNLGNLDLSGLPSELNFRTLDTYNRNTNYSSKNIDLNKLAGNLNSGSIDLSNANFANLNFPKISQHAPTSENNIYNEDQHNGFRQGFAIQDLDYASFFDYVDEDNMNINYQAPIRAEITPGSRQWVTEDEADKKLVDELGVSQLVKMAQAVSFDGTGNVDFLLCTMCKTGVLTGKKLMNEMSKSDREIKSLVILICIQFGLFPKDVCRGMINVIGDEILYVIRSSPYTPSHFCSMMMPSQCEDVPLPPWGTDLIHRDAPRPQPLTPPKTGNLKILHISDLHLDSEYAEGSNADCDFPLCCRNWANSNNNKNRTPIDMMAAKVMADADDPNMDTKVDLTSPFKFSSVAGKWGAFGRCDLPLRTVDHMLEAAAAMKPDIVYVTGDLPAHDVWQQTRASVKENVKITSDRIRAAFPGTPVVMTVGNHEIVPINSFPVPSVYGLGYNPSWLYESLATVWKGWVPASSMDSLRRGGYYSVAPLPGLRVLSLNGNYCNSMNWWLLVAHHDPTHQLAWLVEQLEKAYAAGEKVHIVTHIPPGNPDCEHNWSRQFAAIVTRYASTVTGVFSGHQHLDQWQVIYDPRNSTRPVGVTYIAPSATTFREHSPSFRMFHVDAKGTNATWTVVDHATYTANLTLANLPGNSPVYEQRYTARDAFSMPDLSPQSWDQVVQNMATDNTMFNNHMRFKHNYWSEPTEVSSCDEKCKARSLCFLVTGDSSNKQPCERLKKILR